MRRYTNKQQQSTIQWCQKPNLCSKKTLDNKITFVKK